MLCVYGLDGVGQPIKEVCCRVEEVCAILGKREKDVLTAADLAKLAVSPAGGRKGVRPGMDYAVLFNKADTREREAAALEAAKALAGPETRILMAADLMPPWNLPRAGEKR